MTAILKSHEEVVVATFGKTVDWETVDGLELPEHTVRVELKFVVIRDLYYRLPMLKNVELAICCPEGEIDD